MNKILKRWLKIKISHKYLGINLVNSICILNVARKTKLQHG